MRFYKDSLGVYTIGNLIYPAGRCTLINHDEDDVIHVVDNTTGLEVLKPTNVRSLTKVDGTQYADKEEFLDVTWDFFI